MIQSSSLTHYQPVPARDDIEPSQELSKQITRHPPYYPYVQVRGKLVQGLGEASGFTQLTWVIDQCHEKLGFKPYPGTVNLEVLPEDAAAWEEMKRQPGITLSPPNPAFCDAVCHVVSIDGQLKAAAIVPHVAGYPHDKLELLASGPVVETLGLRPGQELVVRLRSDQP